MWIYWLHPLNKKITLAAAVLSGKFSETETLESSFYPHGENQLENNTILPGRNSIFGVVNWRRIPLRSLIRNWCLTFFTFLRKKSYSVVNTHNVAITQTLSILNEKWNGNSPVLSKFMKGLFNLNPPLPRYSFTWDDTKVLMFLKTLFPSESLNLKRLTWKLCVLLALTTAVRHLWTYPLTIWNWSHTKWFFILPHC